MMYKILILEDNRIDADLIQRYLDRSPYTFESIWISKLEEYEKVLQDLNPDLIISDYNLRYYNAYDALKVRNKINPEIPFIVISGTIGEEEAVNVIKEGAIDFLIKHNMVRLPQIVIRAIEETYEKKEREKAEIALRKEVEFTAKLLDSMSGIFFLLDYKLNIIRVNNRFFEKLGYTWEEVNTKHIENFIEQEAKAFLDDAINHLRVLKDNSFELSLRHKHGHLIQFLFSTSLIKRGGNEIIIVTAIDISDRIEAENKIKEALQEKNILLAEIHHRVKNNLAVVSGMMQLQALEDEDEKVRNKLMSSVNRIKSIALVHEQMYRSESFSSLRFDESLKMLLDNILNISEPEKVSIKTNLDIDEIELNINQALPCAIIVNEIVTNIYKHAFKNRKNGKIDIRAKQVDENVILKIEDDGVGLPDEAIRNQEQSLGFKLIKLLTNQLDGNLEINSVEGTSITLSFSKTNKKGVGSSYVV